MQNTSKIKKGEWIIYTVIWLIVFLMPIFFSGSNTGLDWKKVGHEWLKVVPFLIIFLSHNFIVFPLFFAKKKHITYLGISLLLILAVSIITILVGREIGPSRHLIPHSPDFQPDIPPPVNYEGLPHMKMRLWQMILFEDFMTSVLVIGFNIAIKLTIKWQEEENKNKELEKQKLETELAFLKTQISPHFFMNTLNNIHALIDINSEDAKTSVIKLSKMMRYLLYDSDEGSTTLVKEIEFIKSYVDLMKLRFTDQVRVNLSFPNEVPDIKVPPMLFTSLLENAFKHGVSYQTNSFVNVVMKAESESLFFRIKNSKTTNDNWLDEPGGVGLENLKKRLELLFKNKYSIDLREDDEVFDITIKLPLNA